MMIQLTLSTARTANPKATFVPNDAAAYPTRLPVIEVQRRDGDGAAWTRQGGVLRRVEGAMSVVTLALMFTLAMGAVSEAVGLWARL